MRIDILTIFPNMFKSLNESIIGSAIDKELVDINIVDIREFSKNKHKKVDDYPYGGGAGMLMSVQPLDDAIESVKRKKSFTIYLSASGTRLDQAKVLQISKQFEHLILICGRYEGIDQRIIDKHVDEEISIGDYILTGGEIPAMVLVDSVVRNIKGVLSNSDSLEEESFSKNLLEYPQYTRPKVYKNMKVPDILLSGDHAKIKKWQNDKAVEKTKKIRPDLMDKKD